MAYFYYLVETGKLREIKHTFPIRGHSFLPNDRDFTLTEKKKRNTDTVYHPEGWMDVIKSARRQNPFIVKALTQDMVKDFKGHFCNSLQTTFKDSKKTRVAFKDVRQFHYSEDHKGYVWVKYSMSEVEPWKKTTILKPGIKISMPKQAFSTQHFLHSFQSRKPKLRI